MGENGKLAGLLALVLGFVVGYKWPKIKRQMAPLYNRAVKEVRNSTKRGIKEAVKLFTSRDGQTRRRRKPAVATAAA